MERYGEIVCTNLFVFYRFLYGFWYHQISAYLKNSCKLPCFPIYICQSQTTMPKLEPIGDLMWYHLKSNHSVIDHSAVCNQKVWESKHSSTFYSPVQTNRVGMVNTWFWRNGIFQYLPGITHNQKGAKKSGWIPLFNKKNRTFSGGAGLPIPPS